MRCKSLTTHNDPTARFDEVSDQMQLKRLLAQRGNDPIRNARDYTPDHSNIKYTTERIVWHGSIGDNNHYVV